jgi:LytS/YehU family sensor histidine kinase
MVCITEHHIFLSTPDYSENFASNLSGRMKIAREVANKHMEKNSQPYPKDHHKNAILHPYKEGHLVLLGIYNVKNKNKKLAKRWDSLYKIIKIMGQETAEIKKLESRERSKIVNFANIKLWILDRPANIEPPNMLNAINIVSTLLDATKRS